MKRGIGLRAALILLVLIAIAPVFAVVVQASLAEQRARLSRTEAGIKAVVDLAAAHQQNFMPPSGAAARAEEQLRSLSIPADTTLLVLARDGRVLGGTGPLAPAGGAALPRGFLREALAEGRPRFERTRDAAGKEWLFGLQPVGGNGAAGTFVAALAASDDVLAPMAERLRLQLAVLLAISVLAAGLAWAFADRVLLGPMRRLLRQVDALARGDERLDQPPPPSALRELGELHLHFHDMAKRLAEREVLQAGALAEMEHQNQLLQSVLESMAEGVLVIDARGRFVHVNGAAQRILPGLPLLGRGHSAALAPPEVWGIYELDGITPWPEHAQPVTLALQGQEVRRYRCIVRGELAGGQELVLEGNARPIVRDGEAPSGAVLVFSDITEAYRAESALRDSERRYRSLFESNPHPMWVFDQDSLRFLTVNDAAVAHYGYSREEFLSMTIEDIRPQRDVPALRRKVLELENGLGTSGIWQHRRKDGSTIHAEITSHQLVYDGHRARMVLAHDVTERLLAQQALQAMNETLERRVEERTRELAVANQELESFSYSVSHDLRAPLQVIDGFGRALTARHGDRLDGQARHYLDRIRENTRQMSQLIDDLLALARVTRAELAFEQFDLSVAARRAVERLRQRYPEREVEVVIQEPIPCAGDPRLLAIVMENLVGNAWKFTSRAEHARIEVGRRPGEDGRDVYYVADNGAGFDMVYSDKLFKAFQRLHTASEFEGTGVGLATVHRIVTRHGGRVWAESRPGQGARFQFTLGSAPHA